MAHHTDPTTGDTYADTAFVTSAQRVPGVSLEHMGFGEFTFTTPKGAVEVDRMRGEDFEGQSGRSHKLYDRDRGTGAAEWLVEQVEKQHLSDRVASVELEATWFGKSARMDAASQYKQRMDGIRKGLRHIDTLLGEHEREQSRDSGNWGFAGDLAYVEEHVTDVLEFLRDGKSGDVSRLASGERLGTLDSIVVPKKAVLDAFRRLERIVSKYKEQASLETAGTPQEVWLAHEQPLKAYVSMGGPSWALLGIQVSSEWYPNPYNYDLDHEQYKAYAKEREGVLDQMAGEAEDVLTPFIREYLPHGFKPKPWWMRGQHFSIYGIDKDYHRLIRWVEGGAKTGMVGDGKSGNPGRLASVGKTVSS